MSNFLYKIFYSELDNKKTAKADCEKQIKEWEEEVKKISHLYKYDSRNFLYLH